MTWFENNKKTAYIIFFLGIIIGGINLPFQIPAIAILGLTTWGIGSLWVSYCELADGKKFGAAFLAFCGFLWLTIAVMGTCYYLFGWFAF